MSLLADVVDAIIGGDTDRDTHRLGGNLDGRGDRHRLG
jgi:hypothetical protein